MSGVCFRCADELKGFQSKIVVRDVVGLMSSNNYKCNLCRICFNRIKKFLANSEEELK